MFLFVVFKGQHNASCLCPEGLCVEDDQQKIAESITDLYTSGGLSVFYVVVLFIPMKKRSFYVGGKSTDKFVRVSVQHIARQYESANKFIDRYEERLAPFIKDRGLDWEVQIEVDRNLWRENGLLPPLPRSVGEQEWIRLNKAVPYNK
ncbi:putative oxalocrotonate tautomerase enzyme domain-containing protein [Ditylenchus destructor]|nr:putative oxalocrotonate tautomerase enzyme domain-containing protein [Ditylenchus destructor]